MLVAGFIEFKARFILIIFRPSSPNLVFADDSGKLFSERVPDVKGFVELSFASVVATVGESV